MKRVLRDRAKIRKPSDEPPVKRFPSKAPMIRQPFSLEDLPQEFHNFVLEKMTFADLKNFNFGSSLSARMCDEFELRDGPFPLEEVPLELASSIVEKLEYKDLTEFHMGSKATMKMCDELKRINAPLEKLYIVQQVESFRAWGGKTRLDKIPSNIALHAEVLEIDKRSLEAIERYNVTADRVEFYGSIGSDSGFVKEVLERTRPTEKVYLEWSSIDTLKLEELKRVDTVVFLPWNNFDDTDLLSIGLESFKIGLRPQHAPRLVTSHGIRQFLMEWKTGKRKIRDIGIFFNSRLDRVDQALILNGFPGHPQSPSSKMRLCKEDGDHDIVLDTSGHLVEITEQECEQLGKRYTGTYMQCCVHWSQMRRSPPL